MTDGSSVLADPFLAATSAELRAACPGASAEFLAGQICLGATVAEAKDEFIRHQAALIRSRETELERARAAKTSEPRPWAVAKGAAMHLGSFL